MAVKVMIKLKKGKDVIDIFLEKQGSCFLASF